ncbi:MAG TPA: zf-HC2 domain-containing protein [Casimicrobiaceae bacterium]|nr:zf-HC2 domain-containing protein [Casimicrobiaceae bacterium]
MGLLISCKEASRLLSQMQDGGVPLGRQLAVRLHLLFCDACTRFAAQLRLLRAVMQRYSRQEE